MRATGDDTTLARIWLMLDAGETDAATIAEAVGTTVGVVRQAMSLRRRLAREGAPVCSKCGTPLAPRALSTRSRWCPSCAIANATAERSRQIAQAHPLPAPYQRPPYPCGTCGAELDYKRTLKKLWKLRYGLAQALYCSQGCANAARPKGRRKRR